MADRKDPKLEEAKRARKLAREEIRERIRALEEDIARKTTALAELKENLKGFPAESPNPKK